VNPDLREQISTGIRDAVSLGSSVTGTSDPQIGN